MSVKTLTVKSLRILQIEFARNSLLAIFIGNNDRRHSKHPNSSMI